MQPRADSYASQRQTVEDVSLLPEVADTILWYDGTLKLPLYAAYGVPEVSIEDLEQDQILG